MARVVFINRYFFPDHSATSQILSDLTFYLAAIGHDVRVITSQQLYDDSRAALPESEDVNGVQVHRVASTRFGRTALSGRAFDYLSFYRSARRHLNRLIRHGDIVMAKTDPPLLSVALGGIVRRRGAHLINWLQDIYPETAVVLGVPLMRSPATAALVALRNRSLRQAAATVVVGKLMADRIQAFGVAADRIHVIANWCDDEAIKPIAAERNPLREEWQLTGKFVVGYSGNLGRAHEFETVLVAAEGLRNEPHIVFLMIGGGKGFADLVQQVKVRGLEHSFQFRPYQPRATLPHSLTLPDVHWLSLRPALEALIVPSKFCGVAAAGKPIIMIGDGQGEIGRLVQEYSCGVVVTPGDSTRLAETLRSWSKAPQTILEIGIRARQMLDAHFTRQRAFDQWTGLIAQLNASYEPAVDSSTLRFSARERARSE